MSKHFELMQQIEKENVFDAKPDAPVTVAARDGNRVDSGGEWASDEALRLVQQIFVLQAHEPPHVVVIAGIDHGNGCSRICASVAETLARNGRGRICLVEANFRSPALPGMFGMPNHFGLTEALLGEGPVDSFAKPLRQQNLWLLSSGTLAVDSPSLIASDQLRARIEELRQQFDFVIIDAPPLTRYSDAIALGRLSDGLVMVIEADSTRREAAAAVTASLRTAKVPILAAVLNKRTFPVPEKIYSWL
jgi:receptor protein-tyrosine kinase